MAKMKMLHEESRTRTSGEKKRREEAREKTR